MPNQQPHQSPDPFADARLGFNLFWIAVNGYATAILPFIRRGFGTQFFGVNSIVALVMMLLFGAMEHSNDMFIYMLVWTFFVTGRRAETARLVKQGRIIHSRYAGDSELAYRLFPKARRKAVQLFIEPLLCAIAGAMVYPTSPGVGKFLVGGCVAVLFFNGMTRAVMEQRVRQMHDAHIEQQATARMFRGQDDDF